MHAFQSGSASKTGKAFKVSDSAGRMAAGSKPTMTLAEIERWIGDHIKPKLTT